MELEISIAGETYQLKHTYEGTQINDVAVDYKIRQISDSQIEIQAFDQFYDVELIERDGQELHLTINGKPARVHVKDRLGKLLRELGMNGETKLVSREVRAPMPGTILQFKVEPGDEVMKGDPLLTLVAMKMENIIKSSVNGKVKEIHVEAGQNVKKNDLLLDFEADAN